MRVRGLAGILNTDSYEPIHIPYLDKAVDQVLLAVRQQQRIAIFGDYDCDGVLGTYTLGGVLRGLGAQVRS
ncbi:MAG TPA: hypothetical protein VNY78_08220 [Edaphobacter sp.]|nr:hypothetical protein [Edaphobacter sp.]